MADRPTKLVVDCSLPEGHPDKVQIIPLSDQEILEREQQAAQAAIEQAEREAEAERIAALRASAKAKLIAGEPMTEEEADALLG